MRYRTFKFWSKNGYRILKGCHCKRRTKKGTPLFSENQVELFEYNPFTMDEADINCFFGEIDWWK